MKRKSLKPKTCYLMGLVGAVLNLLGGGLMLLGLGQAVYLRAAAYVMYGAMLLFLALAMQGEEYRHERTNLLGLFVVLLVSYFNLPLLCPMLEAAVLPLLLLLFWRAGDGPRLLLLLLGGLIYALLRTLDIMDSFGGYAPQVLGGYLLFLAVLRFWVVFTLYRRADEPPQPETPPQSEPPVDGLP